MFVLKRTFLLLLSFALVTDMRAGLAGWLTSSTRGWDFIQETGGIRISESLEKDGKLVLPVEYDATGVAGVTHRATRLNSGLVVRKVACSRTSNGQIVIQIVTQLAEQNSDPGKIHYADLDDISAGTYSVYYEDAGEPEKFLGRIQVK
jgi:hypothetical protein